MASKNTPPVCNYEGSDYQTSFWDQGGREYEDRTEAIALKRLLPKSGRLMLELGAGAGRNTSRYAGFERVVLLDYSRTQLQQAQARLGKSDRYVFVASDVYRLPFVDGLFDGATMIRTLHHMTDAPRVLSQIRNVLQPGSVFILEFASKLNLKSILRYWLGRQDWSPFTLEPVEFVELNFDFHPKAVRAWLQEVGFRVEKTLTVSHFRLGLLKRLVPVDILVALDALAQWTGPLWQLTPSVFLRASLGGVRSELVHGDMIQWFKCPECERSSLESQKNYLQCSSCGSRWAIRDGIYDFREPLNE
ncbi:MAG: methyltransferase domain-containing protein [Anaerolineales bacterium]|nr:methyltransferase domain-containing protein [Anaerolineales bacterium]